MGVVFVSQVAATFVFAPVGGFMAKAIEEGKKGRAAGYAQAGSMGGVGFGGGAGIWLASYLSFEASCTIVSVVMLLCAFTLYFVPRLQSDKTQSLLQGFQSTALGVKDLLRSRVGIFTALMVMTPIGVGAAGYMWSSVADDWRVPTDTVALVTGVLSGLVSTIGCIIGGWVADKQGRWWGYFGAGSLMALVTLVMSLAPFSPLSYVSGVLCYAFLMGVANAAFCAALLRAIGTHLAATKYALLSSLGNLGLVYMTVFNGWLHDTYNIRAMLLGETLIGIAFVVVFLFALFGFKVVDKPVVDHSLITSV
jgi:MFS family permease